MALCNFLSTILLFGFSLSSLIEIHFVRYSQYIIEVEASVCNT